MAKQQRHNLTLDAETWETLSREIPAVEGTVSVSHSIRFLVREWRRRSKTRTRGGERSLADGRTA